MIISLEHIHLFISLMFILLQSHCAIKIIMITSDNIKVFIEAILYSSRAMQWRFKVHYPSPSHAPTRQSESKKVARQQTHTLSYTWLYISLRPFSISLDISHSPPTSASVSARECITISGVAL